MTQDQVKTLGYNTREINSLHSAISAYNLVLVVEMEKVPSYMPEILNVYDSVEVAYAIDVRAKSNLRECTC